MIHHKVGIFALWCAVINVEGPYVTYAPMDYDMNDNDSGEGLTVPTNIPIIGTIDITTHEIRNVPDDAREFWGEQYVDISILIVLEREIGQKLNLTMEKVQKCINRTTKFIEKHVKIIDNNEWNERAESSPQNQISIAQNLDQQWNELDTVYVEENLFAGDRGLVKNFNETVLKAVAYPIYEFRVIIGYAKEEIKEYCEELRKLIKGKQ